MEHSEEFNLINEFITTEIPNMNEFDEFCNNLDELHDILNDEFVLTEAVVDSREKITKKVGGALKNTVDTVQNVAGAYDDVTDGGGNLIKSLFDMIMSAVNVASRILKFIMNNVSKIPNMIMGVIKGINDIPDEIRHKIRGDIKLYITAQDLGVLYNKYLPMIISFISIAKDVSQGEVWGTFFNPRKIEGSVIQQNDMKLLRKLKAAYIDVGFIKFAQTQIHIKDQATAEIYFGKNKSIKFTDIKGQKHESTYYEALLYLVTDIKDSLANMETIQKDIGEKFKDTQLNQSLGRLPLLSQKQIASSIQYISKMLNNIGNILRYTMSDISTIDKQLKSIKNKK